MIPIEVEKDESDDSGPSPAEEVKGHERDDQDQEKPGSSVAELSGGESSPLLAEAKGQHSDDEHEEKPEITSNPDTEAPSTYSADVSTMKMALLSGDPNNVRALVGPMGAEEALEALSTTYGGAEERGWDADEDNLFSWTSPILHAARSGNLDIFNSVVAVIRNPNFSQDQVHDILTNVDMNGQSLLALAARSGSKDVVRRVIGVFEEFKLPNEKVKRMWTRKNRDGCSLLALAARSGSKDVVEEVINNLPPNEVTPREKLQKLLLEKDWVGRSVLAMAVRSGSKDVVEEVLRRLKQAHVSKKKVQGILAAKDINGHSLLTMAAQSGSKGVVEHVLHVLRQEELSDYKIQGMLRLVDIFGATLLDHAVTSGNVDTFKTVLRIVTDKLTKQEAREMLAYKDRTGVLLLMRATCTGNSKVFEAVLDAVKHGLSIEEVKLISSHQKLGRSLLESAVGSKEAENFRVAMTSVSNILTVKEVEEVLEVKVVKEGNTGSFLAKAASTGKRDMFQAVLAEINERLSDHQVKEIMLYQDNDKQSLVASAVGSKSVEMFDVAIKAISEGPFKLTEEEVKGVISSRDKGGRSLLFVAIRSGSVEMFRRVFDVVTENRSREEIKNEMMARDGRRRTLLSEAAINGNKGIFDAVLVKAKNFFSDVQVKDIIRAHDQDGDLLLSFAVRSKSKVMFNAAFSAVSNEVGEDEVKKQLKADHLPERLPEERKSSERPLLEKAAKSGTKGLFKAVLDIAEQTLTQEEVKEMIIPQGTFGQSILFRAVESSSTEMFKEVMTNCDNLQTNEENTPCFWFRDLKVKMLKERTVFGWSLLHYAARHSTRETDLFDVVLDATKQNLSDQQVTQIIRSLDNRGRSPLVFAAALSQNVEMFEKVLSYFPKNLLQEQEHDSMRANAAGPTNFHSNPITTIGEAIANGDLGTCCFVLRRAEKNLADQKVQAALDDSFTYWENRYQIDNEFTNPREFNHHKRILSMIFKHSARPPKESLQRIVSKVTYYGEEGAWQIFTERVLSELESATNPLILGMNVSVSLAEAAEGVPEGDQRILLSFQKRVDNYLLKILEWLPQTVRGFGNGMRQCSALFEPEGPRNNPRGRPGPLRMAFERYQHTKSLCAVPLVMNYLSRRFTKGLPNMSDSGNGLRDRAELIRLAKGEDGDGFVFGVEPGDNFFELDPGNQLDPQRPSNILELYPAEDPHFFGVLRVWLQGADASRPSLTFLPGLQFIVAGILAKPNSYYRVPALRMALDFVVYAFMLWAYIEWVLLPEDRPLTGGEIAFVVYVGSAIFRELEEMIRDVGVYFQDRWNVLDILSLGILIGGFIYRSADGGSLWGRSLYALSAPLVFSRLLFYAQFLPFQGSMVEVIFSMAIVILQFGVVLIVVMFGFAMSLFPLLRNVDNFTFDETLLLLFKTLLGDVEAFEEFDESAENPYAIIGRLLLVLYLVVMTIMLLNLLIAVLSTAHAKVEMNTDKGLEVSKVRIVEHYRLIVALDILPAPFNLVQIILKSLFCLTGHQHWEGRRHILQAVGCISFWLVLSPLTFVAGIILWMASSIYSISVPPRELILPLPASAKWRSLCQHIMAFVFCAFVAPICLLILWVRGPCAWILARVKRITQPPRTRHETEDADVSNSEEVASRQPSNEVDVEADVYSMLETTGVGASEIHKYLENPMIDPIVRPDDVGRGTTVEHMKLLRNRLETIFNERVDVLKDDLCKLVMENRG